MQILNEIENLAESHGSFSEGIENEIRKPIYQQMKDNKKSNKEVIKKYCYVIFIQNQLNKYIYFFVTSVLMKLGTY